MPTKRKEAAPAASSAAPAAPAAKDVRMLQECSYILKTFSMGCNTIPLEGMAVHPLNRQGTGVSGKHAQNVVRRINTIEGFAEFRYRKGICIDVNPDDPLENSRFTNNYVAKQHEFLCPVEDRALPGAIAKCHLFHGLLTCRTGMFKFHDTKLPIVANKDDEALMKVFRDGLVFEKLEYIVVVKHKQAVINLMNGDNLDAAFALQQTEMALIAAYFHTCRIIVPRPGQDFWEAVSAEVDPTLGTKFTAEFKAAAYRYSSVLGPDQLQLLLDIYQYSVDPAIFEIGTANLDAASDLPVAARWSKVAAVVVNLIATKQKKVGEKTRGNALADVTLAKLAKINVLGKQFWDEFEKCLNNVMTSYTILTVKGSSDVLMYLGCVVFCTPSNYVFCLVPLRCMSYR